jgi:hypothetical protein
LPTPWRPGAAGFPGRDVEWLDALAMLGFEAPLIHEYCHARESTWWSPPNRM